MPATPLYFGDSNRKLYGVYHHPEKRGRGAPAVLLLNPFGEEAIRAFRIFKMLAERLARNGAAVLRFDYYGSGDAAGDDAAVDFEGMASDALAAHEELEALSERRRFVWIGLALGGAVAWRVSQELPRALDQLFLWEPATSGQAYLTALRDAHIAFLSGGLDRPEASIARATPPPDDMREALGFALSENLSGQLLKLDLSTDEAAKAKTLHLIGGAAAPVDPGFVKRAETSIGAVKRYDDASIAWNSDEALNAYLVPADVLDYIVSEISEAS